MKGVERQRLLDLIADGFDTYLADGRVPPEVEGDNLLGQYMRDVLDRNPHLDGADPQFRASFKEQFESFMSEMSDRFDHIDRSVEGERLMLNNFIKGKPGERRAMWPQVKELAGKLYQDSEVNVDGYSSQLTAENEEVIFDMFAREWSDALEQRLNAEKTNRLASAAAEWEESCDRKCRRDYKTRRHIAKSAGQFPILAEIARIIGRARDSVSNEISGVAQRYLPSSLSASVNGKEIDRITTGSDLSCVIPAEYSYLGHPETEMLFMMRYAQHELQQFTSPGRDNAVSDPRAERRPRPAAGPIIVSVDTSSSMDGRASEIAASMLYQLLDIARREKRNCFLITFSVRSRSIDLSKPGEWRHIDEFLADSFTGGTNGEQMLRDAIRQLHAEDYRMADVLIISDFAFAPPLPETLAAIRREQARDTRFYGLRIGRLTTPYTQILDHIWQVE